nr:hypothetical protein [Pedobacter panaciterrae]
MTWLRFYYYTFLYHYRSKPESWAGEYRSLLLVELSFCWLILTLWLLIDPGLWAFGSVTKPLILLINIITLVILHQYLMNKGRSEAIFTEFKDHPINTNSNQRICWAVWAGSFIFFLISALIQ